jgi:hypothetical protein
MDPRAFVQHTIDRCPAQAGCRDNFSYTYASLNIHNTYWQVRTGRTNAAERAYQLNSTRSIESNQEHCSNAESFVYRFRVNLHLKIDHVNQRFMSDYGKLASQKCLAASSATS